MTESIPEEMSPLWDIYNDGFPDFLAELLEAEELQRLKKVGMHCGCEYSSFPLFRFSSPYTRRIHSVGAWLIVWHFTFDVKQSIAGLLHDIATPVFASLMIEAIHNQLCPYWQAVCGAFRQQSPCTPEHESDSSFQRDPPSGHTFHGHHSPLRYT